jgi:hypothetical protein
MNVPPDLDVPRHIELVATLPERWAIGDEAFQNENWYWPLRQLKTLARFPHKYDTWLGEGHTVTNDDPPQPLAPSTRLCGAILLPPQHVPDAFRELHLDNGRTIRFLAGCRSTMPRWRPEDAVWYRGAAQRFLQGWR